MRIRQYPTSKYRIGAATAACIEWEPSLCTPEGSVAAAMHALNDMGNIVSHHCLINPDTLTQDRITAYALALMRLRECACAAGLERLMNACDALAVTVSRLIEDRSCACHEKCEALTRFVAHAKSMIEMSVDSAKRHALPIPDVRIASDGVSVERNARVPR